VVCGSLSDEGGPRIMKIKFVQQWNEYREKAIADLPVRMCETLIKANIAEAVDPPKPAGKVKTNGVQ
jgi:hypothetical protein